MPQEKEQMVDNTMSRTGCCMKERVQSQRRVGEGEEIAAWWRRGIYNLGNRKFGRRGLCVGQAQAPGVPAV
jgi:hypothetical protein